MEKQLVSRNLELHFVILIHNEFDVKFSCKLLISSCKWHILIVPARKGMIVWLEQRRISAFAWILI